MTEYDEALQWLRSLQQSEIEEFQQRIYQNPFGWMQQMNELQDFHTTTIFLFQNNEEFRSKFLDLYRQRSQVNKLTDEETKNLLRSILVNQQSASKMNKKELGTLIICSLRYCFGRATYMPSDVIAIAKSNWGDLDKNDKLVIQRDLKQALATQNMGHDCDVAMWNEFARWIEESEFARLIQEREWDTTELESAKFLEETGIRRKES